jgi:hypothetical protein
MSELKNKISWRDHAGNLWETYLEVDGNGVETSRDVLTKPANVENIPTVPVPVMAPAPLPIDLKLELPDDIGVKMLFSPKTNMPALKSAHIYFRDADQNLWFAETYTDSVGFSWTINTLILAARPGMPPDSPVAQRQP